MLLIGAGLLSAFQPVLALRPGFEGNLLTAQLSLPAPRYQPRDVDPFINRLLPEIRRIPGVVSAAFTSHNPSGSDSSVIVAEGYRHVPGESLISAYRVRITPEYLRTVQIPLLQGRHFTDVENATSPPVAIVDERLARKCWPEKEAVGQRIFTPSNPDDVTKPTAKRTWITVVGVVAETKAGGVVIVGGADRMGTYYIPIAQAPTRSLTLAVRTSGDPLSAVPEIRRALAAIDPKLSLHSVRTE